MPQGFTLKNNTVNTFDSITLPTGTAAQRPASPNVGASRFNTTSGRFEVYNGSSWDSIALQGLVDIAVDTFTGDGSTTVFGSMTNAVDYADYILVFVNGVFQTPTTNYTVDGSYDITFTSAPPNSVTINVIHNMNSTTV